MKLSVEDIEEIRILMDKMDTNLLNYWGSKRLKSEEVEVRDYINGESEYGHSGYVLFLLNEINDIFITLKVTQEGDIKFEYNGFGMENCDYFTKYESLSILESLRVYIPFFEKMMINLFNFVKMGYTDKDDILTEMGYTNERDVVLEELEK